jgi:hypothetical protein
MNDGPTMCVLQSAKELEKPLPSLCARTSRAPPLASNAVTQKWYGEDNYSYEKETDGAGRVNALESLLKVVADDDGHHGYKKTVDGIIER